MHIFETGEEYSRQFETLLIQHCFGKARDAIESCVSIPVDEGYYVASSTSSENFGPL